MARPCPDCNGTCQSEWRRNLAAVSYNYNSFRFLSLHFLSPPFSFFLPNFFILSNYFLFLQTIFFIFHHLVLNLSSIHWSLNVFGPSVPMHIPNNVVFNHWLSFNFVQGFNKHTFVVFLDHFFLLETSLRHFSFLYSYVSLSSLVSLPLSCRSEHISFLFVHVIN